MKNGKYLTMEDFESFQDSYAQYLASVNKVTGKKTKLDMPVFNITLVVTEGCNLNCTYCYETHKTNKVMSRETARKAIDAILDDSWANGYYSSQNKPAVVLEFIGGEPFLNIDVIDYATEYFKYKSSKIGHPWAENYMISISSNGTLYFNEKIQDYIKRNESHLSLGITIDGNKRLHDSCRLFPNGKGSYDIAAAALKDYNANHSHTDKTTKITLAPGNIKYLNEAIQGVYDLGVVGAFANCCYEPGWTLEHAKVFYSELKKLADFFLGNENYSRYYCSLFDENIGHELTEIRNWCGGNGQMLAIGTDGKCYPCIRFMDYSLNNRPGVPIGDIDSKLDSSSNNCFLCNLKAIDMLTQCKFPDNKKCLTCPIVSGCSLCTGFNYDYYGDPNHKATFICDMHRARVLANAYYWNNLYKELGLDKRFKCNLDKVTALRIIDEHEYDMLLELGGA